MGTGTRRCAARHVRPAPACRALKALAKRYFGTVALNSQSLTGMGRRVALTASAEEPVLGFGFAALEKNQLTELSRLGGVSFFKLDF